MGTVLSISPASKKCGTVEDKAEDGHNGNKTEKILKRHSALVSTLTWKRLVTVSVKKKSAKKVNPNPPPAQANGHVQQLNNENLKKSQQSSSDRKKSGPLAVAVPTVPIKSLQPNQAQTVLQNTQKLASVQKQPSSRSLLSPRRIIIQASTGELLRCLGEFVCRKCSKLEDLTPSEVILWFRNVDRTLLIQGWQDLGFITPANVVFVYLLCRETVNNEVDSSCELQGIFLSCLYLAYSYMGNEISYPLKPFIVEGNKDVFWDRSLDIIDKMSAKMLQLNSDPHFFTEVFQDLKNERESVETTENLGNNLDR